MSVKIKYLGFFLILILFGCKKPINQFEIISDKQKEILKVYSDSTFSLQSGEIEYSGKWTGKLNEGDTISITSTMNGYNVMTLTSTKLFKITSIGLTRIKKDGFQKGWKLSEFIDFNEIEKIKIRNVDGPHYLTEEQWNEIKSNIINAKSIGGLMCKPQWLALIFEFKDGKSIKGSICGDLINFEDWVSGSFKIEREVNLHNY